MCHSLVQAIPLWARQDQLTKAMEHQMEALQKHEISISEIFPPDQLLKKCDLNRIFKLKRRRFFERSSSACWSSPMIKLKTVSADEVQCSHDICCAFVVCPEHQCVPFQEREGAVISIALFLKLFAIHFSQSGTTWAAGPHHTDLAGRWRKKGGETQISTLIRPQLDEWIDRVLPVVAKTEGFFPPSTWRAQPAQTVYTRP